MPNRLADATSPYLLQHQGNPVDWYEWGAAAFAEAQQRDVPVLLSVGYASCHWCHVMAHESFEDEATAALMNDLFVNVKVDREERPDVDRVYMDAVQTMSGRGGWPMTVFLTPGGEPFYAGTYFPKTERGGMPSFTRVLQAVSDAWVAKREEVEGQAAALRQAIAAPQIPTGDETPERESLVRAVEALATQFDPVHGGFGPAPKFPQSPTLEFLLRAARRPWAPQAEQMLVKTLQTMAHGGIHDRIGGGFSRYSVDARWLVPHFEKMLYDNALLARIYAQAWQLTGNPLFESVARDTIEYMLRDLALPAGGFASGEDADSEGEEGKFYVFSHDEVARAAGDGAGPVMRVLGVTEEGNFEGRSILHQAEAPEVVAAEFGLEAAELLDLMAATETFLRAVRTTRVRPGLDDKAVCAWNAFAITALTEAGTVLDEPDYLRAAERTARFILDEMRRPDGRLIRARRQGRGDIPAFCDDYAATAVALFTLYQATGDVRWYREAAHLTGEMVRLFRDDADGLFFATGTDAEELIARPKNLFDNPTPSDNSLAAEAMQHMAAFTGDPAWSDRVDAVLRGASGLIDRYPGGAGQFLGVALVQLAPPYEIALIGPGATGLARTVRGRYHPEVFLAFSESPTTDVPLLAGRPVIGGVATAYVCRGFVCQSPTTDPRALEAALP
ncbi:MAG: thioredoxin domain-containing protein [Acidimicrobiia bacterium]